MEIRTNESGFNRFISSPKVRVPPGGCDSHIHIVGPFDRFPLQVTRLLKPPAATLEDYQNLQAKTGLSRMIVVQPSFYGTDNTCALDAVLRSRGQARAIVVIDDGISDRQLKQMHDAGARGVRLNNVSTGGLTPELLQKTADRIRDLGWHIQLYVDATDLDALAPLLRTLDVPLVLDHMAHVKKENGTNTTGFQALKSLLADGLAWVKLSNALFAPSGSRASELYSANPERVLWGTDWPHAAYPEEVPDDGVLIDDLRAWLPDEKSVEQVLVKNPATLYFG